MIVLVTGVTGLLGLNLSLRMAETHTIYGVIHRNRLKNTPFQLIDADLFDRGNLKKLLDRLHPDVVINCAAIADLDHCEEQPEAAFQLNAEMPGRLANITHNLGIRLIHISTDAVFDGLRGGYRETDTPNPLSVYGRTKVAGERHVLAENPHALIARVNFYGYSLSGSRSLAERFYYDLSSGRPVMGFTDVYFCPLFVDHLADILFRMLEKGLSGLYHVVSSQCLSKYQFGVSLARQFHLDETLISPASWREAGLKAVRSPNLCLDTRRLRMDLGEEMPNQAVGIKLFKQKMEQGHPQMIKVFGASE